MTAAGEILHVSKEEAMVLLSVVQERADNLMIIDLIWHDLYSVVSSWDVQVKALMAVEEYEPVYQLVSVIEGRLYKYFQPSSETTNGPRHRQCSNTNSIDVLAASLPSGSMTGAPNFRSCRFLQGIEQHQPRSIYSGILGCICVSGKGDFSVVTRSVFKWDDGKSADEGLWKIGTGGAVTGLSIKGGEWKEVLARLKSTLQDRKFARSLRFDAFRDSFVPTTAQLPPNGPTMRHSGCETERSGNNRLATARKGERQ